MFDNLKRVVEKAHASGTLQPDSILRVRKTQGLEVSDEQLRSTKRTIGKQAAKPSGLKRLTCPFKEEEIKRVVELLHRSINLISSAVANEISDKTLREAERGADTGEYLLKESGAVEQKVDTASETSKKVLDESHDVHQSMRSVADLGQESLQSSHKTQDILTNVSTTSDAVLESSL